MILPDAVSSSWGVWFADVVGSLDRAAVVYDVVEC